MRQDLNRGNVHWTFPLRSASVGAKRVPLARSVSAPLRSALSARPLDVQGLCVPNRTSNFVYKELGTVRRVYKTFLKKGAGSWIDNLRLLAQVVAQNCTNNATFSPWQICIYAITNLNNLCCFTCSLYIFGKACYWLFHCSMISRN